MNHNHYDVVVIGAGPAGTTLATLLVRQGYQVLLLEREKFPRFHVGESLLPTTQRIWEKLGIAESMQHLGQTFKYAGEFRIGLDPRKSEYEYSINRFNNIPRQKLQERPYAYQVERSEFDLFLLNHARQQGVTVYEESAVKEVLWEGEKATGIRWRTKDGREYSTQVECVADCSGRHALISRSKKLLTSHPTIKTSAVFGHFKGVSRDAGIRQGYFNGYFIENGWFWFIPLSGDIMSVGLVMNEPATDNWSHQSPEEILLNHINRYQFIRDRFADAQQFSKIRMLRGLPYSSKDCAGDGWILVGDANFFVDPLYSSGVHIAFHSAEKAADAIAIFLQKQRDLKPFQQYAKWSKKYQFHVFTTMSLLYKMLKDRISMETYIKLSGKYSNHWNNPILRRVNAWGTGHFDKFYLALYSSWLFSFFLIAIGKIRQILGIPGWDTHQQFCDQPPLKIPKSPEFWQNSHDQPDKSTNTLEDLNYLDRWVVPKDFSDGSSVLAKEYVGTSKSNE